MRCFYKNTHWLLCLTRPCLSLSKSTGGIEVNIKDFWIVVCFYIKLISSYFFLNKDILKQLLKVLILEKPLTNFRLNFSLDISLCWSFPFKYFPLLSPTALPCIQEINWYLCRRNVRPVGKEERGGGASLKVCVDSSQMNFCLRAHTNTHT